MNQYPEKMSDSVLEIFELGFPWQTQDPFLFCVYHLDHYPKGNEEMGPDTSLEGRNLGNDFVIKDGWRMYHGTKIPGFPYHPHRGFETITIVNKGYCDHSDSLGAAGRFGNGDVQWMTAGRGVQHSEMFPLLNREEENPLELFQIWLNLPAKNKFSDPHFKMLWSEDIPVIEEEGHKLQIIAGDYKNQKPPQPAPDSWASDPENQVAIWRLQLAAGTNFILPATLEGINRSLYYYSGNGLSVADQPVEPNFGIHLKANMPTTITNGDQESHLLMLQGRPISEPVAKYGPFVMNTQSEIEQAFEEYRLTRFGGWPWPYPDNVHDRGKGRFALYPDGKLEEK